MSEKTTGASGEVIFEFVRMGHAIRASAFDVQAMREVVMMVPSHTPEAYIKTLLMRKMARQKPA